MPLYDYHCNKCEQDKVDFFKKMLDPAPECCGQPMQQLYKVQIEIFNSDLVFEHVADEPKRFRSKRELRNYCRQNGMTSHYAE